MIRRPPRSTLDRSSAASDVYKRQLKEYLDEARRIQSEEIRGDIETAKDKVIKRKLTELRKLNARWSCPTEPWNAVHPNLIWNIHNSPAAQVSMVGQIQ